MTCCGVQSVFSLHSQQQSVRGEHDCFVTTTNYCRVDRGTVSTRYTVQYCTVPGYRVAILLYSNNSTKFNFLFGEIDGRLHGDVG